MSERTDRERNEKEKRLKEEVELQRCNRREIIEEKREKKKKKEKNRKGNRKSCPANKVKETKIVKKK